MDEPCALLEGLKRGGGHVALNELLKAIQIFKGILPVLCQDLRSKLTPQAIQEVLKKRQKCFQRSLILSQSIKKSTVNLRDWVPEAS